MAVRETIIRQIRDEGPLAFSQFMEKALYEPSAGYYSCPRDKIGPAGDFYTSPWLSSAFGSMIGKQIEEMRQLLDAPVFQIVEFGAGTGMLCLDILHYLRNHSAQFSSFRYIIIEKSEAMRAKERCLLTEFSGIIEWVNDISELHDIVGCIFSNELVDNLAIHRVLMDDELMEIFVDYNHTTGNFYEVLRPATIELKQYLDRFNITLPRNFKTEINLEAEHWIRSVGNTLRKGFVITIDYGYPAAQLYHPQKSEGTLTCYHKHTVNNDPFARVGEQDITAHVNFSSLALAGGDAGLNLCGFTTQYQFLLSLGLVNYIREWEKNAPPAGVHAANAHASLFSLLIGMGQKLKVLVQYKGISSPQLSGLPFTMPLL